MMDKHFLDLFKEIQKDHEQSAGMTLNDKILIVDGLNFFIRAWSATPSLNDDGNHVGGVIGFLKSVGALIRQFKPSRCILVFDGTGGSSRRKKLYPEYKAHRQFKVNVNRAEHMKHSDDVELESMRLQFQRLAMYLKVLPMTTLSVNNVEADDVISYIATELYPKAQIIICSSDKDFLQLVDDSRIRVWSPIKKKLFDKEAMLLTYKIYAHNYLLSRMFDGDNSDNISGIRGVGQKTLQKKVPILFEDKQIQIEDIITYCKDKISGGSKYAIYQKIIDGEDILNRNWKLMNLREYDISGTILSSIQHQVNDNIPELNKLEFRDMLHQDKMMTHLVNFDTWLPSSFGTLDSFARIKK